MRRPAVLLVLGLAAAAALLQRAPPLAPRTRLSHAEWSSRATRHRAAVLEQLRSSTGSSGAALNLTDPVANFLCDYYRVKPKRLVQWSPGPLVALEEPFDEATKPLLLRGESRHGAARDLQATADGAGMFSPVGLPAKCVAMYGGR